MVPTVQQQEIYDILSGNKKLKASESGNIAVSAVAGSGKTTTAVQAAKRACPKRYKNVGFTAFNKTIADELAKKLDGSAQASTLHALGNRLIRGDHPFVTFDPDKYRTIAKSEFRTYFKSTNGKGFLKPEYAALFAVIDVVRSQNIPFGALTQPLLKKIASACDKQNVVLPSREFVHEVVGAALRCLEIGSDRSRLNSIDYGDMIWLPVQLGLGENIFDLLFADEAQDFTPIQQELVCRVSANTVVIGDPYQSIQGWAGADCQSFYNLSKRLKAKQMPLSVCWRCPSSHLDLARILVPHVQNRPDCPSGELIETDSYGIARTAGPGDLVICRNNAPLVGCAYSLMKNKIPALVRGRDIGSSMIRLVEKLDPYDIKDLYNRLSRWKDREFKKLIEREADDQAYSNIQDQVDCIKELSGECETLGEFTDLCKTLFTDSDESDKVILSSVHRSKGLESDNVVLLSPDLMCARASDEEAYQQEKNLLYVALTRAKKKLAIADGAGSDRPGLKEWVSGIALSSMPVRGRRHYE